MGRSKNKYLSQVIIQNIPTRKEKTDSIMLLKTFILFAAGITAFRVPEGAIDGVYSAYYSSTGEEVHTPLNSTNVEYVSAGPLVSKRDNSGPNKVTCGDYRLDYTGTNDAASNLEAQCGDGAFVGKGLSFYGIFNGVVAFYCNSRGSANNCYSSEAADAFSRITSACGSFAAGYDYVTDRSDTYGYQRSSDSWC